MKINAHVLSVSDSGDKLEITAQGLVPNCAEWRPYLPVSLSVPMTDRNRRAFYVGRAIAITVAPK